MRVAEPTILRANAKQTIAREQGIHGNAGGGTGVIAFGAHPSIQRAHLHERKMYGSPYYHHTFTLSFIFFLN